MALPWPKANAGVENAALRVFYKMGYNHFTLKLAICAFGLGNTSFEKHGEVEEVEAAREPAEQSPEGDRHRLPRRSSRSEGLAGLHDRPRPHQEFPPPPIRSVPQTLRALWSLALHEW